MVSSAGQGTGGEAPSSEPDPLAEAYLHELLSPEKKVEILAIFVANPRSEYTREEVVDTVSNGSWSRHKDDLLEYGLIEKGEPRDGKTTFRLNKSHYMTGPLILLNNGPP